jgi:hypothetical protein
MSLDRTFALFRRFESLNIRALLHLQNKITQIEEQFEKMKAENSTGDAPCQSAAAHEESDLLDQLCTNLEVYSESNTLLIGAHFLHLGFARMSFSDVDIRHSLSTSGATPATLTRPQNLCQEPKRVDKRPALVTKIEQAISQRGK